MIDFHKMRMREFQFFLIVLLLLIQACSPSKKPNSALEILRRTPKVPQTRFHFKKDGLAMSIPLVANHDLDEKDENITRALVVIHGAGRNAKKNFRTMKTALTHASSDSKGILIIVPQFLHRRDIVKAGLAPNVLYWSSGWKWGFDSTHPKFPKIGSFDVMDAILERIYLHFPRVKKVTLIGHSAGGQYVQRYAALGRADERFKSKKMEVRYIVANPSSYLYLHSQRYRFGKNEKIEVHGEKDLAACPKYNEYRYGLKDRPRYALNREEGDIRRRYASKNVIYLVGGEDRHRDDWLDKKCQANLQGENRLQRAKLFWAYLLREYSNEIKSHQDLKIIKKAQHSHVDIFSDAEVLGLLFSTP